MSNFTFRIASEQDDISSLFTNCIKEKSKKLLFSKLYLPKHTLIGFENNHPVSMLCYSVQDLNYHGQQLSTVYIFSVVTLLENSNVVTEMIQSALEHFYKNGIALAVILPDGDKQYSLYSELGFADVFYVSKEKFTLSDKEYPELIRVFSEDASKAGKLYEDALRYRIHLGRTEWDWQAAVVLAESQNGGMLGLYDCDKDEIKGYAVFSNDQNGLIVNELFGDDEFSFEAVKSGVLKAADKKEGYFLSPACPHDAIKAGMIRVVNAEKLLKAAFTYRQTAFAIELEDELLNWNIGYFEFVDAKLVRKPRSGLAYITEKQLVSSLLGGLPAAYANLLLR